MQGYAVVAYTTLHHWHALTQHTRTQALTLEETFPASAPVQNPIIQISLLICYARRQIYIGVEAKRGLPLMP